ncbi:MAG TPA: winged helix DNA-binding domain-containing protein [Solirubrobacteraceae bacterium]|nr:winged helix DNA-binding domain-containing protein [Solirubrobacteraceae bacterium]
MPAARKPAGRAPADRLHAERLHAQLLAGPPAADAVAVARRLLAVQGQDPRGARLAVRARSAGVRAADVDRAMSEERTLLITWLNRGTLHLVASEDYPWLHALTTPPLRTANARRLASQGIAPDAAERAVAAIERSLEREGPLTRAQLRERIERADVPTDGQRLTELLMTATLRGVAVRGPMHGSEHAYALVRDWLGERAHVERERALAERERALAELARRYLAGHAPADDRDLARWSGLPLRDARAGLGAIASELTQRADGLLELSGRTREQTPLPAPRLLGAFDPVLLGWLSRESLLADAHLRLIVTANGIFRPFALVRGRAVANWKIAAGEVVLTPFAHVARADEQALRADGGAALRFLGLA